jgi:hypothetical protein
MNGIKFDETGTMNVALPTFAHPLDHRQHSRTGYAGSAPSVFLSASRPRQSHAIPSSPE